ncbi:hypothetical protein DPEC_G00038170 [Dallia pectoralis]|uniref:Uncharacterized protein n=1 Tax=Dallia pectoralis TaxID=75939 RepID=A0ACC2HE55_DALPE|nr:hypothetical protein DPEC_G00038170 [Dallia pectoralis]
MIGKHLLVNVDNWIAENEKAFLPPVCNKLMHFCQLNIMFVGGPNTRKDYHIEEGEELFYQVKGDMCLKVIENDKHKDVHIREGEMFLLPARVPHSPQRQANTVGLVVERRRLQSETDCLRYYVEGTTEPLFEKWFYCEDLGTQLVPVIQEFFASEQHRTGKPKPGEVFREPPFHMNSMHVMNPFNFRDWVETQRPSLANGHAIDLFGAQFETETTLYGPGHTDASRRDTDIWIWQQEGSSHVTVDDQEFPLSMGDSLLILGHSEYQWRRPEGSSALFVVQNPKRKRT